MTRFGCFKNAFTMVTDLSELHFVTFFFSFDTNERNDLYGLWQQHKQLKLWRPMRLDLIFTMMRDIDIYSNFCLIKI